MHDKTMFRIGMEQASQNGLYPYVMERNARISNQLDVVNNNICAGTQILSQSLGAVEQAVRGATRKQRRSIVGDYMAIQPDGIVSLITNYNDETQTCEQLMLNVVGNWQIFRMKFPTIYGEEERFLIFFPTRGIWIVGRMTKNTGSGLYDYFIRAGIRFNPTISKVRIQRVLYEGLVPQIEGCTNMLMIPALAGWYEGGFRDATSFQNLQRGDCPKLSIFEKRLERINSNDSQYKEYFDAIRSVRDVKARMYMMMIPFAGILSSIFQQENFRIPVYFNFIWFADMNPEIVSAFFKIFNREKLKPVTLDSSTKKVATILRETNDETLFVNALTKIEDNAYRKQTRRGDTQDIIDLTLGKCGSYHGYECNGTWVLALLSTEYKFDNHGVNVFVEENFFTNIENALKMQEANVLPEVLTNFISYAERNLQTIRGFIRAERKELNLEQRFWAVMLQVLESFWREQGVNFLQRADLPEHLQEQEWVCEDIFTENEWQRVFVDIVRKEISHFRLYEKNVDASQDLFVIYFDKDFLWIPTRVLERMLGKNGLLQKKQLFLLELRKLGMLVTDEVGLTRRLQVAGVRREYYQIRRELFDEVGKISIVDLGRRA